MAGTGLCKSKLCGTVIYKKAKEMGEQRGRQSRNAEGKRATKRDHLDALATGNFPLWVSVRSCCIMVLACGLPERSCLVITSHPFPFPELA